MEREEQGFKINIIEAEEEMQINSTTHISGKEMSAFMRRIISMKISISKKKQCNFFFGQFCH